MTEWFFIVPPEEEIRKLIAQCGVCGRRLTALASVAKGIGPVCARHVSKGGPGSGHRGHVGRPGKIGGSQKGTGARKVPPSGSKIPKRAIYTSVKGKDLQIVQAAVANLPQEHLDLISGIMQDDLYSSDAACDGFLITLNSGRDEEDRRYWNRASVVHETGHVVQNWDRRHKRYLWDDFKKFYSEKAGRVRVSRKQLQREAVGYRPAPRAGFPSIYSQKNSRELFAESYMLYVRAPKTLSKRAPEIYEYMRDEVFNGVEYVK